MLACAFIGGSANAQVMRPAGTFPHAAGSSQSTATPPPPPAAQTPFSASSSKAALASTPPTVPSTGGLPPSLLDQPAQAAQVRLSNGRLSIDAHNSSLMAILHQISSNTGMKVQGLNTDQRIFGSYGPGSPREVLLSLLDGSGYNVMMVGGTAAEAPLRLELSSPTQVSGAPVANTPTQAAEASDNADNSDDTIPQQPPPPVVFSNGQQPDQPEQQQQPSPNHVRTPQQMLQQLEQMHDRLTQQQQQPQ